MSQVFSTLEVAQSGMGTYKLWIDAIADNVANIDNVTSTDEAAFQERFVLVSSTQDERGTGVGAGVTVTGVAFGDPNGRVTYEPNHPLADENGMVRRPDIDLSDQMVFLQLAQRGYQANINVLQRARESYESALRIGQ
jgi:flagellar basal-body rod protein FlgC